MRMNNLFTQPLEYANYAWIGRTISFLSGQTEDNIFFLRSNLPRCFLRSLIATYHMTHPASVTRKPQWKLMCVGPDGWFWAGPKKTVQPCTCMALLQEINNCLKIIIACYLFNGFDIILTALWQRCDAF